jgi:O-antigen/teichoic acid export membrane protein
VLSLPYILISSAFGKVFEQRVARAAQNKISLQPILFKSTFSLSILGFLPYSVVIILGQFLFPLIFGSEWNGAGDFARWMAISIFFSFINVPSIKAIPLLDLSKHFLIYEVVSTLIRVAGLIFGIIILKSELFAIAIYSCLGAMFNAFLIGYVIIVSKNRSRFRSDDSSE